MQGTASGMRFITLFLPEPYLKGLDELVRRKVYPNRSEAIRMAVRDLLNDELEIFTKLPEEKAAR